MSDRTKQIKFGLHFNHDNPITHVSQSKSKAVPLVPLVHNKDIPSTGIKRAFLVGINYYGTENELQGCINDVNNVKKILIESFKFLEENIVLLSDEPSNPLQPTRENIINQINKIVSETNSGDELVVHFSCHGSTLTDPKHKDHDPDSNGDDDAVVAVDFDNYPNTDGFITDFLLRKILCDNLKSGAKLRAFFDSCHSGSILDLPFMYRPGGAGEFIQIDPPVANNDILCISGCRFSETSADTYINKMHTGALTWALLTALKSAIKIPTTWKELLLVIRHTLVASKYTQTPMLTVSNKDLENMAIDL